MVSLDSRAPHSIAQHSIDTNNLFYCIKSYIDYRIFNLLLLINTNIYRYKYCDIGSGSNALQMTKKRRTLSLISRSHRAISKTSKIRSGTLPGTAGSG